MRHSGTRSGGGPGPQAAMAAPGGAGRAGDALSLLSLLPEPPLLGRVRTIEWRGVGGRSAAGAAGMREGGAADRGLAAGAAAASGERREGAAAPAAAAPPPPQRSRGSPVQGTASARPCLPPPLAGALCSRCVGTGEVHRGRSRGTPRSGRFAYTLICF